MNHNGSYAYTLKTKDGDTYSFIAVDLCPRPGLGAPFNFYGRLNEVNFIEISPPENLIKNCLERKTKFNKIIRPNKEFHIDDLFRSLSIIIYLFKWT